MHAEEELSFEEMIQHTRSAVLDVITPVLIFDGWSQQAISSAIKNARINSQNVELAFPRGRLDMACEMHRAGDREFQQEFEERHKDISKIGERVEAAVLYRLVIAGRNKEVARATAAFFALPQNSAAGAGLIWDTVDKIWKAVGVEESGASRYTRRAILATIYSATFLYWLQDEQADMKETQTFLKRRLLEHAKFHKLVSKLKIQKLKQNFSQARHQ